jgi:putative transposase
MAAAGRGGAGPPGAGAAGSPSSKLLDAGPAVVGYADQCWTLARVADQVWRRFGAEHTLAGMDVLLHRIGR